MEDRIKDGKDTALANLPSADFPPTAWAALVMFALALVCWVQPLLVDGELGLARHATLRYRLWHVAARIASRARRNLIRLDARLALGPALQRAFQRLFARPAPAG